MTRTTMYVAVLCLGVGLFAGFGLQNVSRGNPRLSENSEMTTSEIRQGDSIRFVTDSNVGCVLSWTVTKGDAKETVYTFPTREQSKTARQLATEAVSGLIGIKKTTSR